MRARSDIVVASILAVTVDPRDHVHRSLDLHVMAHGDHASAWLIRIHRKQIHKSGAFDLRLPHLKEMPTYMRVLLEALRRREHRWEVVQREEADGDKVYRVRWLQWRSFGPQAPRTRPNAPDVRKAQPKGKGGRRAFKSIRGGKS